MNKKVMWYKKSWVKMLYSRDIIINEDSMFFNMLLSKHWTPIESELDMMYYHFDICLNLFNKSWQQDFLWENFYELYKSFQMLMVNNNYLSFFFLLNMFFFFFEKDSIPLLVKELIGLNFSELFWIIFSLKTYVEQLSNLKSMWKYFLNMKILKFKWFSKNWNLIWTLLWSYEMNNSILEMNNSKKYKFKQMNELFICLNLYFLELFISKILLFTFKNWYISSLDCWNMSNSFLKKKQNFLYLNNYKTLEFYSYLNKENFVFLESKHFLEMVTYYTTFSALSWMDLYFKLNFKQQVMNY